MVNLKPILDHILAQYSLPLDGYHGVSHWARVLENGLKVAELSGANIEVVTLFSVLHDSQRVNESYDPRHGPRAAEYASSLRGSFIYLSDEDFQLLFIACRDHTNELTHSNVTIQTCWDADRLDLARVGINPIPDRLCTDVAKSPQILQWSNERAREVLVPSFVETEWGICL